MRGILCSLSVVTLLFLSGASRAAGDAPVWPLDHAVAQSWRSVQDGQLSADGAWLVYVLAPDSESKADPGSEHDTVEIIVRSVSGESERRYPAGLASRQGGGVQLSASGRWAAFHHATATVHEVVLIELDSEAERRFDAQSFQFIGSLPVDGVEAEASSLDAVPEWLVLTAATSPSSDRRGQGTTLQLHSLSVGTTQVIDAVHAVAFDPTGSVVAIADHRGLRVQSLLDAGDARVVAPAAGGEFSELTWSAEGSALAAVHTAQGADQGRSDVYAITGVRTPAPTVVQVEVPDQGAVTGRLHWRDELDGVYYQVRHAPRARHRAERDASDPESLSLWHWQASLLPMEQRGMDARAVTRWHYLSLSRRASVQLDDEHLTLVSPQGRGDYALAYDVSPYGWMNGGGLYQPGTARQQRRDYYLIELATGERRVLMRDVKAHTTTMLTIAPQLTPDGRQWLYWQAGDYLLRDLASGRTRNLTASLPVRFSLPENDVEKGWFPDDGGLMSDALPLLQGWSRDGEYVLVSSHWDIWALPLKGKAAFNVTGDGAQEDRIYRRADLRQGRGAAIGEVDLGQPMYLTVFDRVSGERGLARWQPGVGVKRLHQAPAYLTYIKASSAPVWVVARMTASAPVDYYAVEDFRPGRRLTDGNPQARQYTIGGVRYLRYRTSRGDLRHATLLLPVGYEAGRRYPMVVEIYKGKSVAAHGYISPPGQRGYQWLSRGYAMLLPDIIPRMNEAGPAALESVLAGVDAAIDAGVADPERLGLYGFSYGGFQTLYIISQSPRFKVAADWAGPTNFWNWCTDEYAELMPGMTICEFEQPYLSSPFWMQASAYLSNSPLYHARDINTPLLLAHGDQDDRVPFYHSVMLFNTLRRLEKPVVLLAYAGEGHGLDGVRDDVWTRRLALFDHYLRDAPAPAWWRAE